MKTPEEAFRKGNALLNRMKGKGWKLDVWENLGWWYCVYAGPISVYPTHDSNKFHCLMAEGLGNKGHAGGGSYLWKTDDNLRDPNELVKRQIQIAQAVVDNLSSNISKVRKKYGL